MTSRRTLTFIVLALALIAPAAASADKKPVRTTPKIYILLTDGATNKTVSPSIQTSFSPPKGTTTAKACKGKVTVSAPIGKKTVKKKKKTIYATKKSALKTRLGVCTATSFLPLPASFYGKTVKFTARFPGNEVVKKFKKSSVFTVVTPPPPPAPAAPFNPTSGPWIVRQTPNIGSGNLSWAMTVGADGTASGLNRFAGISLTCTGGNEVSLEMNEAPFDSPFKIAKTDVTASDDWTDPDSSLSTVTSTFVLHFDSAGHATGTFRVTGSVYYATGALVTNTVYTGCDSGPINVELQPGQFM